MCIIVPNFAAIVYIEPLLKYSDLTVFKIEAVRHLGFALRVFGPPTKSSGLCNCVKFGYNRCSSFDNMQVLIFARWAWKCLFTPQNVFVGIWPPKMGCSINAIPRRRFIARKHLIWRVDRRIRSTGACSARAQKYSKKLSLKRYNKKPAYDMSRVCPDHPRCRSATWIGVYGRTRDVAVHRVPKKVG